MTQLKIKKNMKNVTIKVVSYTDTVLYYTDNKDNKDIDLFSLEESQIKSIHWPYNKSGVTE